MIPVDAGSLCVIPVDAGSLCVIPVDAGSLCVLPRDAGTLCAIKRSELRCSVCNPHGHDLWPRACTTNQML